MKNNFEKKYKKKKKLIRIYFYNKAQKNMSINQVFNNSDIREIIFKKQQDEVMKIKTKENYQSVVDEYKNMMKYCNLYHSDDETPVILDVLWETIIDVSGFGEMWCISEEERLLKQQLRDTYYKKQPKGYKKAGLLGYEYEYDLINGGLMKNWGDSSDDD